MENLPAIIISSTAVIVASLVGAIASALYSGGKTYKTTKISKAELSTEHAGLSKEYSEKHGALSKEHSELHGEHTNLLTMLTEVKKDTELVKAEAKASQTIREQGTEKEVNAHRISQELLGIRDELTTLRIANTELREENIGLKRENQRLANRCDDLEETLRQREQEEENTFDLER